MMKIEFLKRAAGHAQPSLLALLTLAFLLMMSRPLSALPVDGVDPANDREYAPAVRHLIQNAKKQLLIQLYQARFYEEYPETVTNHFIDDLIGAAKRGVDVRILIDTGGWNPSQKNEYNLNYVDRLTSAGIKVWEDSDKDVSHQKVLLCDDDLTLVASANWTYYSMSHNHEVAAVVRSRPLNAWFRGYFQERVSEGKPRANTENVTTGDLLPGADGSAMTSATCPIETTGTETGRLKADLRPGEEPAADVEPVPNRLYYPAVHEAILNARKSVDVVQRSITLSSNAPGRSSGEAQLPGEPPSAVNVLVQDLIGAARRGVKVRVILDQTEKMDDSSNDASALLLKAGGVQVMREDLKVQTHAKMVLVDDDQVIIGSTNWTRPAIEEGNEISVLIKSKELGRHYRKYVDGLAAKGAPYKPGAGASIWSDEPDGP